MIICKLKALSKYTDTEKRVEGINADGMRIKIVAQSSEEVVSFKVSFVKSQ